MKGLRTVIAAQQELLRIALYMMTQGPIAFGDQELKCSLEEDQVRAACAVAMGAGQSLNTILKLSDANICSSVLVALPTVDSRRR